MRILDMFIIILFCLQQEGYSIGSDFHLTTFQDLPKPPEESQDEQQVSFPFTIQSQMQASRV